jgi:hypothetical protein
VHKIALCIFMLILLLAIKTTLIQSQNNFIAQDIDTKIHILPNTNNAGYNKSFQINVWCNPAEPVKAWEMKFKYDPTIIRANFVSEGDLFEGYSTLFSSGKIDNINGTISDIYNLILGTGNVTANGTLVTMNFTSLYKNGVSLLETYDVGIANETQYLLIEVINSSILIYQELLYPRWDLNQDGRISIADVSLMVAHYGEDVIPSGGKLWDIDADGKCDIIDVTILASNYGKEY